ncbi:MAG: DHH family phosphoesterase [Thermodesulfobacteriota bacterium]
MASDSLAGALADLAGLLAARDRIVLLAHVNPDGDALGSLLALGQGLLALGKQATMYCQSGVPSMFAFLPGANEVVTKLGPPSGYEVAVLLDHHDLARSGRAALSLAQGPVLAVIDHHPGLGALPGYALVDTRVSSAGELVFYLLEALGARLTPDMAANLFVAVSTDTGSFSFSNTTPECLAVSAELVRSGARPWELTRRLYMGRPRRRLELLGLALKNLEFFDGGRIGAMTVTSEMMAATGTDSYDTDGFVEYPRSVAGVELAILFREIGPASCQVSLRSLGRVNAAELAQTFGGGGHAQAAGFSADQPLAGLKDEVIVRSLGFLPPRSEEGRS